MSKRARGRIGFTANRLVDVLTSATLLVLLTPVIVVVAAAIKAESRGSVCFWCRGGDFGGRKVACACSRRPVTPGWGCERRRFPTGRTPDAPNRIFARTLGGRPDVES